jgi:hypothetical protein
MMENPGKLRVLAGGDRVVELLMTIPGRREIGTRAIRAYTDDIKGSAARKSTQPVPGWFRGTKFERDSASRENTKRGPEELRTALVQVVIGGFAE